MTPARLATLERAQRGAAKCAGYKRLAALDPDDGLLTRRSSPVLFWLADQFDRVCWLPPVPPAPARATHARGSEIGRAAIIEQRERFWLEAVNR